MAYECYLNPSLMFTNVNSDVDNYVDNFMANVYKNPIKIYRKKFCRVAKNPYVPSLLYTILTLPAFNVYKVVKYG